MVTVNRVKIIKTVLATVALKLLCLHIWVMTITVNQLDVFRHCPWPNEIFSDVLWDDKIVLATKPTVACGTSPKMPWFLKTLNNSITDYIEVKLCTSQDYPNEATPLNITELFFR